MRGNAGGPPFLDEFKKLITMYTAIQYSKILYTLLFSLLFWGEAYSKQEMPFCVLAGDLEETKLGQSEQSWVIGAQAEIGVTLTERKPCGFLQIQTVWGNSGILGNALHLSGYTIRFVETASGRGFSICKEADQVEEAWIAAPEGEDVRIGIFYATEKGECSLYVAEVPLLKIEGFEKQDDVEVRLSGAGDSVSYLKACRVGSCERWVFETSDYQEISETARLKKEGDKASSSKGLMVPPNQGKKPGHSERGRKGPWVTLTKIGAMDVSQ